MSNIRLKYSGLVNFASRIVSVATGLMFTILVTRRLSEDLFGTWQFYLSLLNYFVVPSSIVNYWLTRDMGRGRKVARSGIVFSGTISMISAILFVFISPIFRENVNVDVQTLLAFTLWIIIMCCASSLEAICNGIQPQTVGYGVIVFEVSKVIFGAFLVGYLKYSLFGAVLSIDLALVIQVLFYLFRISKHLKEKLSLRDIERWLKTSWIPLISILPWLVFLQDAVVITLMSGSLLPIAYIRAANIFTGVISFSGTLAAGLYPKLLSGGSGKDIEESFELVLLFLVPMVFGQLILAEPILYILRKEYAFTYNVLRILVISSAISTIKGIFSTIILGIEKADVNENISWRSLVKSYLIKIPLAELFGSVAYVLMISIITSILRKFDSPILISLSTVACLLIVNISLLFYYMKVSRRFITFSLNLKRVAKFLLSALIMVMMILVFYPESAKSEQIFAVLLYLMPVILIAVLVYFAVLLLIDVESRELFKKVFKTLKIL
ncbi:MAG: hypothetical protein RMI79_02205 [Nitrososphaerota archaeon]|nr:hypothetical protein [Nitrososphaerota archaeon]